ncbi:LOW QUALITY PROTEIN: gastrokine-1-like [Morus bassanus]
MKFTIVTTVLLGLLLTPALADYFQNRKASKQITITGGYQILTINNEWNVVTIEEESTQGSWKTIWNYKRQEGSILEWAIRNPVIKFHHNFESRCQSQSPLLNPGRSRTTKKQMTFIIKRTIRDVKSYGLDIFSMCRGLTTYVTYRVHSECKQMNDICN